MSELLQSHMSRDSDPDPRLASALVCRFRWLSCLLALSLKSAVTVAVPLNLKSGPRSEVIQLDCADLELHDPTRLFPLKSR